MDISKTDNSKSASFLASRPPDMGTNRSAFMERKLFKGESAASQSPDRFTLIMRGPNFASDYQPMNKLDTTEINGGKRSPFGRLASLKGRDYLQTNDIEGAQPRPQRQSEVLRYQ